MSITIKRVTFKHFEPGQAIGVASPRLSWRFAGDAKDWYQRSYDIRLTRKGREQTFHVETHESVLVPWPDSPLQYEWPSRDTMA
jgi:alpha-L-rhamnosidase